MRKYLSVPAGRPHVADPSIGYAKAAPNADGAGSATVTVFGVYLGSDANATAVTSYSIDYELDGGAKTRALSGQTGTRASFVIPDVALGAHTCRVTVTTADNRELVTLLDFSMTEPWCASPLPTDDSAVRTDGTLKYAYAPSACTVNGVQFAAAGNGNAAASGDIDWPYNMTSGALAPSSVSGAYYEFLNRCWWANQGDKAVTLKNLTAGRSYLVQIFGYRNYNGDGKAHVWIRESYWDPNFIRVYGDGWSCGGTLTGTFTATGSTKTFTVTSDGNYGINGIQVRELGEGGESTDVPPGGGSDTGGGEELTGEFVKKTFIASNKLHLPYRVAAKADPNGGKVPVVVFLHGYGQCGVDNSFTINEMTNIKSYLDGAGGPGGYKLLVPQCPNDVKWAEFSMNSTTCTFQDKPSSALAAVFDLLDSYAAMADVDVNRIYVTGLSMGGHGTWDAICRRPDFFAAAMPCCGGGDPVCAADIAHVPVLAVHNRGDPTIPCEQTENMVTALRALGSDVIFEKLENNSHDAWTTCYSRTDDVEPGEPNHRFVWMFAQNRATNNRPKYPRITELTASPSGSSATISLAGVVLGTDADSVPATGYSVAYRLDGSSSAVTALSGQAADSSFTLEGLADGNHTCEVTITTDKGRTKTKSVVFYVNTSAVSDVWTSGYMDAEGNSFSTEGTLRYAYSTLGATVNGIRFERDVTLQGSSLKISFVPNIDNFDGSFMNEGVGGDFGLVLGNGWYWNGNESGTHTVTLTLSNLEGGRKYLVQFLSHSYWNNTTTVSANGCEPVHIHGDSAESGKYGALVTGVFTADSATKDVTVIYQGGGGKMPFNAVQVRELPGGETGGGDPAPVVYFENSAAADGVLTLEIPKAANEPCCFYRIVAE